MWNLQHSFSQLGRAPQIQSAAAELGQVLQFRPSSSIEWNWGTCAGTGRYPTSCQAELLAPFAGVLGMIGLCNLESGWGLANVSVNYVDRSEPGSL